MYGHAPSVDEVVLKANRAPEEGSDPQSQSRQISFSKFMLRHEMRIIDGLDHPNICTVLDHIQEGDREYFVMPRYGTSTLANVDTRDVQTVGCIAAQVSAALTYMHAEGLVHRDVKPSNIVIAPSGKATLIDFETAFSIGATPLELRGTRQFMSPEHQKGQCVSTSDDVYSLCATIYATVAKQGYASVETTKTSTAPTASQVSKTPPPKYVIQPLRCLGDVAEVIFDGLNPDSKQRPTMAFISQELASQFGLKWRCS